MMKNLYLFLIFFLQIALCPAQNSQKKGFTDVPYIEVTGTAEMEVVPDEIYLKIVVESKGKPSLDELEKGMLAELQRLGIDVARDLSLRDVASNLKSYWLKGNVTQTTKEYVLLLHEVEKLKEVFQGLDKLGVSNLSIDKVSHSRLEELRLEVKVEAVKAAKKKAMTLADAAGRKFGTVIYINDMQDGYGFGMQNRMDGISNVVMKNVALDKEADVTVEFEKIRLRSSIVACFSFS